MKSFKDRISKKQPPPLPDRGTVESPEKASIYEDQMAQATRAAKGVHGNDSPNDTNEHLQLARAPQHKLEENKTSKSPHHLTQAQNDQRAPSPLYRAQSEDFPKRRGSIAATRRKDINPAKSEEFVKLNNELIQTQNDLHDAVEQLALLHSSDPFRAGDDRISREMDDLRADVRLWSQDFYHESKKSVWQLLGLKKSADEESPFGEVTNHYATYLKDSRGPTLLVQGLIWQILLTDVFDRFLWLGGPCQSSTRPNGHRQPPVPPKDCRIVESFQFLVKSSQNLKTNERTYHHWRAHAARLLVDSPNCHQACIKQNIVVTTDMILSTLKNYMSKKDSLGNGQPPSRATKNLTAVVKSAISFDQRLWQQKASFYFRSNYVPVPKNGAQMHQFDPQWMTSGSSEAQGSTVKIFSVPALYKQGTSEGENYSNHVVICKAHVDCLGGGA